MVATFNPPYTSAPDVLADMREHGYAVLTAETVAAVCGAAPGDFEHLRDSWNALAPDRHLLDAGHYRKRRHACFVIEAGCIQRAPHRAHWQSREYNALHGGLRRWFEPVDDSTVNNPVWSRLLLGLSAQCSKLKSVQRWYVEAHQFRIDTSDGIGRPTPEGAHRDGVDFVAVLIVDRVDIRGGETRVFEASGPNGQRFTLDAPWSLLLLDDSRVIHESTPIQPLDDNGGGHRDTLVLTWRADGFQGD